MFVRVGDIPAGLGAVTRRVAMKRGVGAVIAVPRLIRRGVGLTFADMGGSLLFGGSNVTGPVTVTNTTPGGGVTYNLPQYGPGNPAPWPPNNTDVIAAAGISCLPPDWPTPSSGYYSGGGASRLPPLCSSLSPAQQAIANPGTVPVLTGGGAPQSPAAAPTGTTPPSNVASSVTFTNLSRGSGNVVGDSWRLDIYGAPNSPVSITATQNGTSLGTTPMGKTDASGHLSLSSTFDASTVGSWRELVTVGTVPAPLLTFTVAAASAQQSPSGSGAGAGGGNPSGSGSGSGSGGTQQNPAPAGTGFDLSSFFSSTFSVGGYNIPVWGALAGVGAVLFFAPRGR